MGNYTNSSKWRQQLALGVSLALSMLLIFAIGRALVAADNGSSQVNQDDTPTPEPLVRVITQTDGTTTVATLEDYLAGHTLTAEQLKELEAEGIEYTLVGAAVADFSGSEKRVVQSTAEPGATLNYSIVISNSGTLGESVVMTDTLPSELTYVNGSLSTTGDGIVTNVMTSSNEIVWEGTVAGSGIATISFAATLDSGVAVDDVITNEAALNSGGTIVNLTADTTIVAESEDTLIYMPLIFQPLAAPTLTATRPNSANDWTVSWSTIDGNVTSYQLQESHDPTFTTGTTTYNESGNSRAFSHSPDTDNVYYYRVRGLTNNLAGPWSDTVRVIGGYVDEFTSNQTGWEVRRTTFIEEVQSFYEIRNGDDWFILRVEDSWDWGIASPLEMAPEPPYAIEYRVKPANIGNLVSFGVAFGGDWDGRACPDKSSVAGWYEHDICFNQFYNTNTIWFSGLKLLFERVDNLVWCPQCGGSPMKRLGDITGNERDLSGVDENDWNNYRIEVRDSGIRFFVNGSQQYSYSDTRYINRPYFGVFASTDEYSNSTARFEYIRVLPLDN